MQGQKGQKKDSGHSVLNSALSMAFGTAASRILGLVRDLLFAAFFSRTVTDAWTAAFKLPNMFRRLLGEGSLSVSFIPVFVQTRVDDPTLLRSHNLVNSLYSLLLVILSVITALGVLFPEYYMDLVLDPNYRMVPGKYEMTIRMAQIMFSFLFFISNYAFFMGILNALGNFSLPAIAPTFFNLSMIIANFIPQDILPYPGDALAWGVVIGGALQMGILIPALYKKNYLPKWSWDITNPDMLRVLRQMLPGILGLGLSQILTVINLRFASSLGEGPISYIYLADRLLELPLSLVAVSLGTALLPTLSELWARNDKEKMLQVSFEHLRMNLFIAIPAAIGLFLLAQPIISVLFQRGKFSEQDVLITSQVLMIYAGVLVSSSCVRVFIPTYYAMKNTWFPALVSALCLVIHIFLAPALMQKWGLHGLNFATFINASINFILLFVAIRFWIPVSMNFSVFKYLLKILVAAAVMYVCVHFAKTYLWQSDAGFILRAGILALLVAVGVFSFALSAKALQLAELDPFVRLLKRKLRL